MSEENPQQQSSMIGGEIMEVMMTGGDIGEMNEETVAQVVNMLQSEGQLSGGNNTIIIRQPGSDEIQMIQMTNNGGELIVSKASEADIQALQAGNGVVDCANDEILTDQQGQVMMMDEGGNLVEGVVQMPSEATSEQMALEQTHGHSVTSSKQGKNVNVLSNLAGNAETTTAQLDSVTSPKPITISTGGIKPKSSPMFSSGLNGDVVSIKINTGLSFKRREKSHPSPQNVIKISTITGQQKHNPPKFHKCEACAINFVSKVAYMIHMENCPSKRRALSSINNKTGVTFTCVFCDNKFTSRLVLMQHVRTCDKAKSSKNISDVSKLKVATIESKLKSGNVPNERAFTSDKKMRKVVGLSKFKDSRGGFGKGSILDPEDEPTRGLRDDSEEEDENAIEYDDEEDLEDERDLTDEENLEEATASKRSQKHLGPILVKGMFKCRDCNRTFSKEHQYNRHVKACTNAPLNTSRIDADFSEPKDAMNDDDDTLPSAFSQKRKRGRPPLRDYANHDGTSLSKRQAYGPKIASVNQKSVVVNRDRLESSDLESDEEFHPNSSLGDSHRTQGNRKGGLKYKSALGPHLNAVNKVVKISPSDSIIKQTSKALMNKMNKEKFAKLFKETPFCGLCGDKFKKNEELVLHTQISHSEDLLQLRDSLDGKGCLSSQKCPLCDLHFVSPHVLLLHMVSTHERHLKSAQEALENQNVHLVCPFCFEFSLTQDLLKEHLATRHLDKLANRPSATNALPVALELGVAVLGKEEDQLRQSTLKLGAEKGKVYCPECGLMFFKSYFEHHRCAADSFAPSSRRFLCSEPQCSALSFYKLIHLLTHLQQVHAKVLPCETETFESSMQFLEWLKAEEGRTKTKFTKALQRMKSGKMNAIWICHRFCSSQKDAVFNGPNASPSSKDRLNRCYSRIHTEVAFNPSTSRYDGQTVISYFSKHHHPTAPPVDTKANTAKKEVAVSEVPASSLSTGESSAVVATVLPPTINDGGAFADADELRHLLEGDEEPEPALDENGQIVQSSRGSALPSTSDDPRIPVQRAQKGSSVEGGQSNQSMGQVPHLEPLSDADLLLEKMLGETDDSPAVASTASFVREEDGQSALVGGATESGAENDEGSTTYMLPADAAEWSKLFELAASQAAEDETAASLLRLQTDIMALPIEKQIEVFNKLCSFANV